MSVCGCVCLTVSVCLHVSVVVVCVWRVCVWGVQLVPAYLSAGLKKDAMEAIPFVDRPATVDSDIMINSPTATDILACTCLLTY